MDNSRIGSTTLCGGIVREFRYASIACPSIVSYTCPSNGSLVVFFSFEASLSEHLEAYNIGHFTSLAVLLFVVGFLFLFVTVSRINKTNPVVLRSVSVSFASLSVLSLT